MAYQSKHTGDNIDKGINLALAMYPVGSIYLSVNNVNPGTIFGGTWEQIQDRFLLAAGSTYGGGSTGGSANHTHTSAAHTHTTAGHTLTEAELPTINGGFAVPVIPNHASKGIYGKAYGTDFGTIGSSNSYGITQGMTGTSITTSGTQYGYGFGFGGGASHSHGNTGSTTPGNTGSSSSLPPYLAIYVWKRTA